MYRPISKSFLARDDRTSPPGTHELAGRLDYGVVSAKDLTVMAPPVVVVAKLKMP